MNVLAEVLAELATEVGQETGNKNLKDQVLQPQNVGATVQSFRDAKLADLLRYPSKKLNCATIVAGFNDNSSTVSDFANDWRFLILDNS